MMAALAIKPVQSLDLMAEIVPGVRPTWHIARCHSGHENIAAAHLAGRRFGVYVPMEDIWKSVRGKGDEIARQNPLFPGYVFVFLWGLAEHVNRVRNCPGISGFLVNPAGNPILVPDDIVKQIQEIEWKQYLTHLPRGFFRRRRRHEEWVIQPWKHRNYGFADPDPNNRIAALKIALGLYQT